MELKVCTSCGAETSDYTEFLCPNCGKETIIRCKKCREAAIEYTCPNCGWVGP